MLIELLNLADNASEAGLIGVGLTCVMLPVLVLAFVLVRGVARKVRRYGKTR